MTFSGSKQGPKHRLGRHGVGPVILLLAGLGISVATSGTAGEATIAFAESSLVAIPAHAQEPRAIAIALWSDAVAAVPPNSVRVQLDAERLVQLPVTAIDTYINGDYMLRAQGMLRGNLYSLALTLGNAYLFGHLSSAAGTVQFYAEGANGHYSGWQYRPVGLGSAAGALQHDFLIPDHFFSKSLDAAPLVSNRSVADRSVADLSVSDLSVADRSVSNPVQLPPRLELQLTNSAAAPTPGSAAATVSGINANNFRVTQSFDRSNVLVGGSVTATLRFENISAQKHTALYAEMFFVLENSVLQTASTGCRQQLSLSLQKVLYCELGDFAPGEIKQFSFRVAVTDQSKPRVFSTPVVGNFRYADATINVVADVRSDTDGDGISDYNENLLGTNPANAASVDYSDTVIDVMAFYTAGAKALYPLGVETRINQLISVANQVYADSGVGIRLRPVFHGEVAYTDSTDMDTALDAMIYQTDPAFANLGKLREIYGGDLVMLLRPLGRETSRCGLAPVGGYNTNGDFSAATEKQFAFAHIGIDCPTDIVVAHELGHNMGLTHSHKEDGGGGSFDFGTGFGVEGQFATVMALPAAFNASTRIAQFSNPRLVCLGFVCGRDAGLPMPADAAQALNIVKYQLANYYPTKVPDLPRNTVTTLSGKPTTASIAMAASHNNGLSFTNYVTPADLVDVFAEISVDPAHVGAYGNIYVLITAEKGQVFQLNSAGGFSQWDGTATGLIATIKNSKLHKLERLSLLQGFQFDSASIGREFNIYIAYEVSALQEVVYTTTPLVVRVRSAP